MNTMCVLIDFYVCNIFLIHALINISVVVDVCVEKFIYEYV